jgi:PAS domain S-box-containing protein
MLDMSVDEIISAGKYGVLDPADPRVGILTAERQRTGRTRGEVTLVRKDGSKIDCELSSAVFMDKDGNARISIIARDVTDRKKAEENIARLNRLYAVLSKVNEAIVRIGDPKTLYDQVCRILVEDGLFKMAWIGIVDHETRRVDPVASFGDNEDYLQGIVVTASDAPEGRGPTGRAAVTGTSAICSDIEHDPVMLPWRDKALKHGFRSSAAFPLHAGSAVIGAFTLYSGTPQFFNEEENALLVSLANDVSFAIEKIANERRRKEAEQRTDVSNKLLWLFTRKLDKKEYLDAALGVISSWVGCHHAGIRVIDQRSCLPFESCQGYNEKFLTTETVLSLQEDNCICTRIAKGDPKPSDRSAMTNGGSFYSLDAQQFYENVKPGERGDYRGHCITAGFHSLAIIPIRYRDEHIGAIHLADERPGIFRLGMVEFLEYLSFIIGEAILRFSIEEERARLASAVQSTAEAVAVTDTRGMIQYINPAFERITGYSKDEILGRDLHFLDSGRHGDAFYAQLREILARNGVWSGQFMNKKKDGSFYYEDCTISPIRAPSGEIVNYVSVRRDVTDKLRLESIAESVNAMENIGYVFSGVRHEIGNPINSLNAILTVLRSKLDTLSTEAVRDYLGRMSEQIGRVEYILRSLKSFNLYETQEPYTVQLSSFMDNFLMLIKNDFEKNGITIATTVEPDLAVHADPRALQQIMLNVMTNAADAVRGGREPRIMITAGRSDGKIVISVQDNGQGITEEKMRDIFKPFYTTKAHGTGLGLVIVKKMLTHMRGAIDITSGPDAGTTVYMTIPEGTNEEA